MAVTTQADVALTLIIGRSWRWAFDRRRRTDQTQQRDLSDYVAGYAQLRVKRGDVGEPLLDFDVEIVLDADRDAHKDYVLVTATADDSAELEPGTRWFDCFLVDGTGDTLVMCPPVPIHVGAGVSRA